MENIYCITHVLEREENVDEEAQVKKNNKRVQQIIKLNSYHHLGLLLKICVTSSLISSCAS